MKKTRFEEMQEQIVRRLGPSRGPEASRKMQTEYQTLCSSCGNYPQSMQSHLQRNILPVVSAFRALLAMGTERTEAAALAQDSFLELMNQPAEAIRKALKVPGLYRLMPLLWKKLMPKMFSEDSGFRFRFYPTDNHRVRFDMLQCPYHQICKDLDCPELAPTFCTTDDICYGHMHPKLIWNRTKTIARGADLCDFDLYIPK